MYNDNFRPTRLYMRKIENENKELKVKIDANYYIILETFNGEIQSEPILFVSTKNMTWNDFWKLYEMEMTIYKINIKTNTIEEIES